MLVPMNLMYKMSLIRSFHVARRFIHILCAVMYFCPIIIMLNVVRNLELFLKIKKLKNQKIIFCEKLNKKLK